MNSRLWPVFPLLLVAWGSANADWESSILPRGFAHESSLAKAVATAQGTNKSVILYYTRTNCPPCTVLQQRLRNEAVGAPFREGYVFTAVWGTSMGRDERESYRTQYLVRGAPTWLAFNRHGKYVCTARGGFDSDEAGMHLHKTLQSLLATSADGESNAARPCM